MEQPIIAAKIVRLAVELPPSLIQSLANAIAACEVRDWSYARQQILQVTPQPRLRGLIDEFLDLHYGKAAPPIRRFINMYHDRCEAKGIHRNCFGRAVDYAIDETIAKAALEAFDAALALADSDAVRSRVEKASICAYRAAIDPAWEVPDAQKPLEAAQVEKARPLVRRLFELCAKYKVPMFSEGTSIDQARQRLRTNLGLGEGEEF